ncbi:MAG TPA: hypothetical protein VKU86_14090 [Acidimicrobiales bacterium]|nr:hypothetical protein [Acidimicrobiales bacterium]
MTDLAASSESLRTPTPVPSADWRQRLPEMLAGLRVAFGLALMVAPSFAAAPYLGAEARRPSVRFTSRLFGVRDAALGVAVLSARRRGREDEVTRALWLSAACDAFDATAAFRRRELSWWGRLLVGTTALAAAGLGAAAALTPGEQ